MSRPRTPRALGRVSTRDPLAAAVAALAIAESSPASVAAIYVALARDMVARAEACLATIELRARKRETWLHLHDRRRRGV